MKFAILALATVVSAKYRATTTRYYDGLKGACGCGTDSGLSSWQLGVTTDVYTAAASQALFDTNSASWCGGGCGKCYNLTSTGEQACSTCGAGATAGTSIIVMVSNLCPYNGNEKWCPNVDETNNYGFSYHFDIMAQSEVFGDNAVVEFEPVACPGAATTDFETCQCYGELETDVTPVGMTTGSSAGTTAAATTKSSSSASASSAKTSAHTTLTTALAVSKSVSTSVSKSTSVSVKSPSAAATTAKDTTAPHKPKASTASAEAVVAAAAATTANVFEATTAASCAAAHTYTQTVWV